MGPQRLLVTRECHGLYTHRDVCSFGTRDCNTEQLKNSNDRASTVSDSVQYSPRRTTEYVLRIQVRPSRSESSFRINMKRIEVKSSRAVVVSFKAFGRTGDYRYVTDFK